ncbi:ATP synthase F0 subunit C [Candidatus Dependentiae bacterium]
MLDFHVFHYFAVGLSIAIAGFGVPIGVGIAVKGLIDGTLRQVWAYQRNFNTLIMGTLMIESSLALAFIAAFVTLLAPPSVITLPVAIAEFGSCIGMGVTAAFVAIAVGYTVRTCCVSVARNPFEVRRIQVFMFILMTLIETPVIFSFLIWLFVRTKVGDIQTYVEGMKLCAAGFAMAIGSIGSAIGQKLFVEKACRAIGHNMDVYNKIFTLAIITEAMIETPILLTFIMSIMMILRVVSPLVVGVGVYVFFAAAIAMGFGSSAVAIGIGRVGGSAASQISRSPESYGTILATTFISQAFVETSSLFSFLVALLIVMRVTIWKA